MRCVMLLRQTLRPANPGPEIVFILRCADTPRAAGKFILGRDQLDASQLIAVFDDSAAFHKDLADTYGVHPLGGGWCEIDHTRRQVTLSGRSTQFGREPDRELVLSLFRSVFDGYFCWHED